MLALGQIILTIQYDTTNRIQIFFVLRRGISQPNEITDKFETFQKNREKSFQATLTFNLLTSHVWRELLPFFKLKIMTMTQKPQFIFKSIMR